MSNSKEQIEKINRISSNLKPIGNSKDEFEAFCKLNSSRISTGWLSVDKALNGGITNELYIMGAETSTGKSAFMMAMAQNIAENGCNVLYFSLEMSQKEFIARGISNLSFLAHEQDKNKQMFTTAEILFWSYNESTQQFEKTSYFSYEKYAEEYFTKYGKNLYIVEGGINGFCAKDIANIAAKFKKIHNNSPVVVFVDYLQLLKADDEMSHIDRKTKTDVSVTTLKALASQIGIPVFTVSSVSRSKYGEKISTSSYKESGDTEYTGGIMIGWNWHGVTDEADVRASEREKKACQTRGYRKMTFEILKYRNAERDKDVKLVYYPASNTFVDEFIWKQKNNAENPFSTWDSSTTTYV